MLPTVWGTVHPWLSPLRVRVVGCNPPRMGGWDHRTVPNKPKTPNRTFRIPDDIFYPARERAREDGTTLAALVNDWMHRYAHGDSMDED